MSCWPVNDLFPAHPCFATSCALARPRSPAGQPSGQWESLGFRLVGTLSWESAQVIFMNVLTNSVECRGDAFIFKPGPLCLVHNSAHCSARFLKSHCGSAFDQKLSDSVSKPLGTCGNRRGTSRGHDGSCRPGTQGLLCRSLYSEDTVLV